MFVSLTSLLLDFRYPMKDELNEGVIIKGRLLTFIPMFLSLLIGAGPILFVSISLKFKYFHISYMIILFSLMIIEIIYMIIYRKKLMHNLLS